jgi:hypothetical protein
MRARVNGAKVVVAVIAIVLGLGASFATAATERIPARWKNCTIVNKRYPHGVGKFGARDLTKGDTEPVTNFRRSNVLYRTAMRYNRGLDRDHDRIACEKL